MKKFIKFLTALFFMKKGYNDKNMGTILSAYSRGVQKLCFVAVA